MPQAALAALFEYWGASAATAAIIADVVVIAASVYVAQDSARRQQNAAKDAYNASLVDRYVMVRGATEPRRLVLGRQRVSGPLFYVGSYGTSHEHLVFTVALAGHEVDAIEAIYFDDEIVSLDGSGNVTGVNRRDLFSISTATASFTLTSNPKAGSVVAVAKYGTNSVTLGTTVTGLSVAVTGGIAGSVGTVTISYLPDPSPYVPGAILTGQDTVVLNGSGNGSVTLAHTPLAGGGNLFVTYGPTGFDTVNLTSFASVAGNVLTVTGSTTVSVTATVSYTYVDTTSRARVRMYTGAPGQAADAGMISALPGVWTSAHKATGVAYLVVELDYDPNAFPTGLPNVSAQVRGRKVYDPRTGITQWSENPVLLMRAAATDPLCGRLPASLVNDGYVVTQANICDTASTYIVNGQSYTRALYTAGLVIKSGTRPADALNDLAQAMAGKWTFIDGLLRIKAGYFTTPLQTLDETWLHNAQAISIQPRANRADVYNTVTGKFADEQSDYQVLDYPQVQSAPYVTEDGIALPLDVPLNAVTFIGQAQQVAAAMMRDARQGMRVTVVCNMRAYPVEVFDTLYVTLSRFGWLNKPFEVYGVSFTLDGGIQLTLKESDTTAWALGTTFPDTDPAPNTLLPSPFTVQAIAGLSCASGSAQQINGTFVTRIVASWTALTDPGVIVNGGVEVRYGPPSLSEAQWTTVTVNGSQSQALLPAVIAGQFYVVKARSFNTLCKGTWCTPVLHQVVQSGTVDSGQLASTAATEVYVATPGSSVTVTQVSFIPDGFGVNTIVATVTFTPSASGRAQAFFDGHGHYVNSTASIADANWSIQDAGGTYDGWKRLDQGVPASATIDFSMSTTRSFAVTGGTSYTIAIYAHKLNAGDTFTVDNMELRVEVVKR